MSPLLATGLLQWIVLAASIALHEYGHAKSADLLGDDTPRRQGRVTLNPFNHLDPIGTGLIPLFNILAPIFMGMRPFAMIGWGRPVMINLQNFPVQTRTRDHLLSVAAGPLMNVLIALISAILMGVVTPFVPATLRLFEIAIFINATLIIFNLLPIPPLDGSHFARYIFRIPEETYARMAMPGIILLLVLINIPAFRFLLGGIIHAVATPFFLLASVIFRLVV